MADELVSVVIPVYNGERFLAQAIESVLGQTWREVEVIVVDDGSSDHSGEIARRFAPVRCLRQDNAGQAAARNRGAAAATGRFLAFLDADDLWLADKLERQLTAFRSAPDWPPCSAGRRNSSRPDSLRAAGLCVGCRRSCRAPC